ncbi:hypothetical protein CB1_000877001 [Camelus ferus]|nr:hypothetical protein CB1_000877001 [Camelus ferus]
MVTRLRSFIVCSDDDGHREDGPEHTAAVPTAREMEEKFRASSEAGSRLTPGLRGPRPRVPEREAIQKGIEYFFVILLHKLLTITPPVHVKFEEFFVGTADCVHCADVQCGFESCSFDTEHDLGNFAYHIKMGPQKFGNPDADRGEALGAACHTGRLFLRNLTLVSQSGLRAENSRFQHGSDFSKVTTLVNTSSKGPSGKKKGRSKKAHVLAASVEQATQNFLEKGEQIAKESQDLKEELVAAVEDVRKQGNSPLSVWDPSKQRQMWSDALTSAVPSLLPSHSVSIYRVADDHWAETDKTEAEL